MIARRVSSPLVRETSGGGGVNVQGEKQTAMDVFADTLLNDALRPLAACLRAASAWRRKAHDSLEGQGAPARQIAPGQLLGLAQRGRAMPFVEGELCEQLEERAADARDLDRELSRALDGVTTPNLQTLKELRERCRDFVGVKLEARRELDSLCDAAEQWAKDARRIFLPPARIDGRGGGVEEANGDSSEEEETRER